MLSGSKCSLSAPKQRASAGFALALSSESACLDMHGKSLKDQDLSQLVSLLLATPEAQQRFNTLKLNKNRLTNECATDLCVILQTFKTLTSLDLSDNKFKGTAIPKLIHSITTSHPSLTRIVYIGNHPGPDGLEWLGKSFQESHRLESLNLGWKILSKERLQMSTESSPDRHRATYPLPSSDSPLLAPADERSSDPITSASSSTQAVIDPESADNRFAPRAVGGLPAQSLIGRCKYAVVSPDGTSLSKFKGGHKYNANVQWEPTPSPDSLSAYSYTVKVVVAEKKEIYIGWAPRDMEPMATNEYQKIGAYLSNTGSLICSDGSPGFGSFEKPPAGGYKHIRTTYDIVQRTICFEASTDTETWHPLCLLSGVPAQTLLVPTVVLGREGAQIQLIGSVFDLLPYTRDKHSWKSIWVHGH